MGQSPVQTVPACPVQIRAHHHIDVYTYINNAFIQRVLSCLKPNLQQTEINASFKQCKQWVTTFKFTYPAVWYQITLTFIKTINSFSSNVLVLYEQCLCINDVALSGLIRYQIEWMDYSKSHIILK